MHKVVGKIVVTVLALCFIWLLNASLQQGLGNIDLVLDYPSTSVAQPESSPQTSEQPIVNEDKTPMQLINAKVLLVAGVLVPILLVFVFYIVVHLMRTKVSPKQQTKTSSKTRTEPIMQDVEQASPSQNSLQ